MITFKPVADTWDINTYYIMHGCVEVGARYPESNNRIE